MKNADYFIGIEDLRNYFSTILAASANSIYKNKLHPLIISSVVNFTKEDFNFIKKINLSSGFIIRIQPFFITQKFGKEASVSLEDSFPELLLLREVGYNKSLRLDFDDTEHLFLLNLIKIILQ